MELHFLVSSFFSTLLSPMAKRTSNKQSSLRKTSGSDLLKPQKVSQKPSDIIIRGARVHNLKNLSITLPRNKLIVVTGVSGSGKSSLAFDTIYAEGQRRYVESLSSYARSFLNGWKNLMSI